jgi:hypothetical protein
MTAGLFVPLQANFFGDDRIVRCSRMAQLVYLQGLTIAKQCGTDGTLTFAQLERECGDIPDLQKCVNELTKLQLWRRKSGRNSTVTFTIARWLKHNRSQEWIEKYRAARAEDGKRGGRPPGEPPNPPKGEKGNPFESEKGNPFGNPAENGKGQKGTENLEGRQREEREKTETETTRDPIPAANSREDDPREAVVCRLLAKRATDKAGKIDTTRERYEGGALKTIIAERADEIRSLLRDRPSASAEEIVDSLERGNGYQAPSTNGARPNPYDAQQVAERKRQAMSPRDHAQRQLEDAERMGDVLGVESARDALAALDGPHLVAVAS